MSILRIARKLFGRIDRYFGSAAVPAVWAIGAVVLVAGILLRPWWLGVVLGSIGLVLTWVAVVLGIELRVSSEVDASSRVWTSRTAKRFLGFGRSNGATSGTRRYSPLSVPATRGIRKLSGSPGRGGADIKDDPKSDLTLEFLTDDRGAGEQPMVDMIGSPDDASALATVADVRIVSPGLKSIKLRKDCAYFIIVTSAFRSGAWCEALDASNARIAQQVIAGIYTARAYSRLTVLVDHGDYQSHFSDEVRSLVDVAVSSGGIDAGGRSVRSRVLDQLEQLASNTN